MSTDGGGKDKDAIDYDALASEIAKARAVVDSDGLEKAVEALLVLEKTYRLQADLKATTMCCVAVVQVCFEQRNWTALNENVILVSKRRSQLKLATASMVKEVIGYIDETEGETRIELIKTLLSVADGKIFLELERARLTRRLAKIYEDRGDINDAAEALQEVAVETFGAMAKTEKIAFILEQVRLCMDKKDFIRAHILIKKVAPRAFSGSRLAAEGEKKGKDEKKETALDGTYAAEPDVGIPNLEELKLLFYRHFIRYYEHASDSLEICRCYQNIYDTPCISSDADQWMPVLKKMCWHVVLAPSGPMQQSILNTIFADSKIKELPVYESLLKIFVRSEIVSWAEVEATFAGEMMEQASVFSGEKGQKNKDIFKLRIVDHNILVISKYYSQITLSRLADILKVSAEESEKYLSDLISNKSVSAKIHRPNGVVNFMAKLNPDDVLTSWSSNISKLLDILEKSCHKIHKQCQQHKVSVPSMEMR